MASTREDAENVSEVAEFGETNWRSVEKHAQVVQKGMNRPGLRWSSWKQKCRRSMRKRSTRQNWISKSVHCGRVKVDQAATHLSPMGAASIHPSWNSSSRWEQRGQSSSLQSSKVNSTGLTCSISQGDASTPSARRAVGKGATSHGRSRRRLERGAEEVSEPVYVGTQRRGEVAIEVFQLVLFVIPLCSQIMVQEATEVNLTHQQTVSSKRRPFDNKDKISVATWRSVKGRHGTLEKSSTHTNSQGTDPRTFEKDSQGEDPGTFSS